MTKRTKAKPEHYVNNKEFTVLQLQNTIVQLKKQFQRVKNHQELQNILESVSIRLQQDYRPNQTSLTILIGMK